MGFKLDKVQEMKDAIHLENKNVKKMSASAYLDYTYKGRRRDRILQSLGQPVEEDPVLRKYKKYIQGH